MIGKVRFAASSRTRAQCFATHRVGSPCAMFAHSFAALAFAATLLALSGCSGGCSREQPQPEQPPVDPVVVRMNDPEYRKQLYTLLKAQAEIAKRANAVRRELEAARAEDPESEKTKELEKQHKALGDELEKMRKLSMKVIQNRAMKDIDSKKNAAEATEGK